MSTLFNIYEICLIVFYSGVFHEKSHAIELAPIDYIPRDLLSYFRVRN